MTLVLAFASEAEAEAEAKAMSLSVAEGDHCGRPAKRDVEIDEIAPKRSLKNIVIWALSYQAA